MFYRWESWLSVVFSLSETCPVFLKDLTTLPFVAPDTEELHRQYEVLKAAHPNTVEQQLVRIIINRYALRQGIVGALTSMGGVIALPLGLSIDLVYAARSNASLSYFIAQIYGIQNETKTLNLGQLLVLRQRKVSVDELVMWQEQMIGVAYQQLAQTVLQKTLAKVIPGAGAVIGFIVNYTSAQLFGTVANQYYSGNLDRLVEGTGKHAIEFVSLSAEQRQNVWQEFKRRSSTLVESSAGKMAGIVQKLQEKSYDPSSDRLTQLSKLADLKTKGDLTEEEFSLMKQALLAGLAEEMSQTEEQAPTSPYQPNSSIQQASTQHDGGSPNPLPS